MFEGFAEHILPTRRGVIHARVGGSGPPVLLLHGYPQTHLMWHAVAGRLAERFTVVAADLPGYGASFRPSPTADHEPHSKRASARDLVEAMTLLGHRSFAVAGHDRGGRVAYRMALDHPASIVAAAVLDVVPTGEVWARADAVFPSSTIDRHHDDADTGKRRITCPLLVLWSTRGALPRMYGDVLDVWRPWAEHVSGLGMPGSHFFAEDEPERTAAELVAFLDAGGAAVDENHPEPT